MRDHKEDELSQVRQLFKQLDLKGKGSISVSDLRTVMRELEVEASDEELSNLVHQLDQNNDGTKYVRNCSDYCRLHFV